MICVILLFHKKTTIDCFIGTIISIEHILYFLTLFSTTVYRTVRFHVAVKFGHVKVALWFPINKFHKKMFKNKHTYKMINASNEGIYVKFWRKNNTTLVYLFSKAISTKHLLRLIILLNIIFANFSIWLLGYRPGFSCL